MKSKHVEMKIKSYRAEAEKHLRQLKTLIENQTYFTDSRKEDIFSILRKDHWTYMDSAKIRWYVTLDMEIFRNINFPLNGELEEYLKAGKEIQTTWLNEVNPHIEFLAAYHECDEGKDRYTRYLDSEKRYFRGDIIITDPCYIMKPKASSDDDDDWARCNYGDNMEVLGITNFLTRSTLYGDWSCTTFNSITRKPIGEFCADAGLVSVFSLEDVLKYNPGFNYHIERPWTTTLIKDFQGEVQIVVKCHRSRGRKITEYYNDDWMYYECQVVGKGINLKTGEPIEFVGKQTGM